MLDEMTERFEKEIIALGLVPLEKFNSTKQYFVSSEDKKEAAEGTKSLIGRFKSKFSSLIKK